MGLQWIQDLVIVLRSGCVLRHDFSNMLLSSLSDSEEYAVFIRSLSSHFCLFRVGYPSLSGRYSSVGHLHPILFL